MNANFLSIKKWIENLRDIHKVNADGKPYRVPKRVIGEHVRAHTPRLFDRIRIGTTHNKFDLELLFIALKIPTVGTCEGCGNPTSFNPLKLEPKRFCCSKCISKSPSIKQAKENTCMEKNGVRNVSQVGSVKQAKANTCFDNYGKTNPSKVKAIQRKKEQTSIINRGVPYFLQSKEGQETFKKSCMDNLGVEWPMQSNDVKNTRLKTFREKYPGKDHPTQTKAVIRKREETCLAKRGVRHHFHVPEIFAKLKKNSYKIKKFISKDGTVYKCQGAEPQVLSMLDGSPNVKSFRTFVESSYTVPYLNSDGNTSEYQPDISVTLKDGRKLLIEVKSPWILNGRPEWKETNLLKFKAAEELCVQSKTSSWNFWLAIVGDNGKITWYKNPSALEGTLL